MPHRMVAIASRLVAVLIVLDAVRMFATVPYHIQMAADVDVRKLDPVLLLGVAVYLAVAAHLWLHPFSVAQRFLPATEAGEPDAEFKVSESAAFRVLVTVLGIYLVITATASLTSWLATYVPARQSHDVPALRWIWAWFWEPAAQLLLGFVLILRRRGLRGLVLRLRRDGLRPAPHLGP